MTRAIHVIGLSPVFRLILRIDDIRMSDKFDLYNYECVKYEEIFVAIWYSRMVDKISEVDQDNTILVWFVSET